MADSTIAALGVLSASSVTSVDAMIIEDTDLTTTKKILMGQLGLAFGLSYDGVNKFLGLGTTTPTAGIHLTGSAGGEAATIRIAPTGVSAAPFLHMQQSTGSVVQPGYCLVVDTDDTFYIRHYSAYTSPAVYTATFPFFIGAGDQIVLGCHVTAGADTTGMGPGDVAVGTELAAFRIWTGATNLKVLDLDANDNIKIGGAGDAVIGLGNVHADALNTGNNGDIMIVNDRALRGSNAATSGSVRLIEVSAADKVLIDGGSAGTIIKSLAGAGTRAVFADANGVLSAP